MISNGILYWYFQLQSRTPEADYFADSTGEPHLSRSASYPLPCTSNPGRMFPGRRPILRKFRRARGSLPRCLVPAPFLRTKIECIAVISLAPQLWPATHGGFGGVGLEAAGFTCIVVARPVTDYSPSVRLH